MPEKKLFVVTAVYTDTIEVWAESQDIAHDISEPLFQERRICPSGVHKEDYEDPNLNFSNWHAHEVKESKTSTRCAYCDQATGHKMSCESPENRKLLGYHVEEKKKQ